METAVCRSTQIASLPRSHPWLPPDTGAPPRSFLFSHPVLMSLPSCLLSNLILLILHLCVFGQVSPAELSASYNSAGHGECFPRVQGQETTRSKDIQRAWQALSVRKRRMQLIPWTSRWKPDGNKGVCRLHGNRKKMRKSRSLPFRLLSQH